MNAIRTFAVLSLAILATGCAGPGATAAASGTGMAQGMSHGGTTVPMADMQSRMEAMQEMHRKMMSARTPAEREALMADHMKAMRDGMAMMKDMHDGMQGMGGMDPCKGMSGDKAERHQMMTEHMAMMQLMLDMMMQRMPAAQAER